MAALLRLVTTFNSEPSHQPSTIMVTSNHVLKCHIHVFSEDGDSSTALASCARDWQLFW